MRCLCQVSSYESSYVSIGDCFAALLKSSCHSAWGGGSRGNRPTALGRDKRGPSRCV